MDVGRVSSRNSTERDIGGGAVCYVTMEDPRDGSNVPTPNGSQTTLDDFAEEVELFALRTKLEFHATEKTGHGLVVTVLSYPKVHAAA